MPRCHLCVAARSGFVDHEHASMPSMCVFPGVSSVSRPLEKPKAGSQRYESQAMLRTQVDVRLRFVSLCDTTP